MKAVSILTVAAAAFAACGGDLSLGADAWEVRYAGATSMLTLSHPASGTVVEGELSFDGDLRIAAATSHLALVDAEGRTCACVAFPRNGNRVGLQLAPSAQGRCKGTLFFEGAVQYHADSRAGQSIPFSEERVLPLSSGDADRRINDTLHSPSKDEALVVRCDSMSFTSAGGGRYGLEFSLAFDDPASASAQFTVEPQFLSSRRWDVPWRPPLASSEKVSSAGERRVAATVAAMAGFPGVRPAAFFPFAGWMPAWDLAVRGSFGQTHLVAVFNLADAPAEAKVEWEDLGEDPEHGFIAYELWDEAWTGVLHEHLEVQVPPKDVRLFVLQPKAGHPQFLAPNGVSPEWPLKAQTWTEDVLKTTVALKGGKAHTLRYAIPDSFTFDAMRTSDGVASSKVRLESGGRVLAVTLTAAKDGEADIDLRFK